MTGWRALAERMDAVETGLRRTAPDPETAAAAGPYVARLLASALEDGFLAHQDKDNGLRRAWPRIGAASLDLRMWQAPIEPGRSYRLTGTLNDVERLGVGVYSIDATGALIMDDYALFRDGAFALEIGPGAQLATGPATRVMMVRELFRSPASHPAALRFAGADGQPVSRPMAGEVDDVVPRVEIMARQFARWSELMAQNPNSFTVPPDELAASYKGDAGTHYYPGYFLLEEDEVLVIERPAVACSSWSIQSFNHWLEPLSDARTDERRLGLQPGAAATIQLAPEADGATSPTIVTGLRRGALLYRTYDATDIAVPRTRIEKR